MCLSVVFLQCVMWFRDRTAWGDCFSVQMSVVGEQLLLVCLMHESGRAERDRDTGQGLGWSVTETKGQAVLS